MNVEEVKLPFGHPLTDAYVSRSDPRLAALFGGHPDETKDWRARAEWLAGHPELRADSRQLAAALAAFNESAGASRLALDNAAALGDGALAVVGGQQAGLLTGPIMVIHKAATIIQAARWAERELGRRVVPVFWIAGEDHDWEEANHAYVVSEQKGLSKLTVARPEHPRTSVSRTVLDPSVWQSALAELGERLPDTAHKPALLTELERAASGARTLTSLFARLMARLFADEGLVLADADDPALRRLEAPMFARLAERSEALTAAYDAGAEELRRMGYALQAETAVDSANLFVFRDERLHPQPGRLAGERVLLLRDGDGFTDRKRTFRLSGERLIRLAHEAPELMSNNVLTRPLMQDYVLPVLATVLGAGEIAYWAQTPKAFAAMGMRMPIVMPRMSFTFTDDSVRKLMDAFGLTFDDVSRRFDERRRAWLDAQDRFSLDETFRQAERRFIDAYEPLLRLLPEVEAGLAAIGETNKRKIIEQIHYLRRKTEEAHRLRHDTALRRFERIGTWLMPDGKPQERVLNFTVLSNKYGREWLNCLLAAPFNRSGGHYVITL